MTQLRSTRDDGVGRDFQNMAEAFCNPFSLPLRSTPLLDIAEDEDDSVQLAIIAVNGRAAVVDRGLLAVSGDEDRVVAKANDRSCASHLFNRALDRLPGVLVDDSKYFGQRVSLGLCKGPSGKSLGNGIHAGDAALCVGDNDGVSDALQDARGAGFALPQPARGHHFSGHIMKRTKEAGNLSLFKDGIEGVVEVKILDSRFP